MILILLLSIIGFIVVLIATWRGIGLMVDSATYVASADFLYQGKGYRDLYGNFPVPYPPLYPAALAFIKWIGVDLYLGTRFINAISFGGSLFFSGYILYSITDSISISSLLVLFFLSSSVLMGVFSMLLRDPLYLFLVLGGIFFFIKFLVDGTALCLILSSSFLSLAFLCKYPAFGIILSALAILLINTKSIYEIVLFSGISLVPTFIFAIYNLKSSGRIAHKSISFQPISLRNIKRGFMTMGYWFFPRLLPPEISTPVSVVLLIPFLMSLLYHSISVFALFFVILIAVYIISLLLFMFLWDPRVALYDRMLSPVYFAFFILIFIHLYSLFSENLFHPVLIVYLFMFLPRGIVEFVKFSRNTSSPEYYSLRDSELMKCIRKLPANLLFSNIPAIIYLFTRRISRITPLKIIYRTNKINKSFATELKEMGKVLEETNGALVFFTLRTDPELYPTLEEIENLLSLKILFKSEEGWIFQVKSLR